MASTAQQQVSGILGETFANTKILVMFTIFALANLVGFSIKDFNLNSKTILDVGCGLGDFLHYLKKSDIKDYQYIGLDISKNMIKSCRERHLQDNVQFYQGTIFEYDFETIDVAILSGALSYKYKEATSAAKATLEKMFQLSSEGVALNFLSTTADYY